MFRRLPTWQVSSVRTEKTSERRGNPSPSPIEQPHCTQSAFLFSKGRRMTPPFLLCVIIIIFICYFILFSNGKCSLHFPHRFLFLKPRFPSEKKKQRDQKGSVTTQKIHNLSSWCENKYLKH
uniref:Transmembrane protein n=1 Tax=Trypanosoma vivax (strain Y486) TaxID=1055687 RepID=G0U0A2_TRYVY|nr:hypothetical protein, unlikely [Trypanosoma vivax Y486]